VTDPTAEQPPVLATGQDYAGWTVERELARGGMGVLYLARHPRLPRTDVIKVLSPYLSQSQRFRDRFLAEATRMSSLSHPHVMPVHDSGQAADGTLYLVMPYVAGGDLRKLLRDHGALGPRRSARLIAQVGAALDAAHRIGVVHRDVKPENVLLSSVEPEDNDHALLTDFGISREELSTTTLTGTGELLLTPAYAAPEQALGHTVDARADQYALACILIELLTGHPPFENPTPVALLMAHLQEPVPKVAGSLGLPGELDEVLGRALSKQPENRYANCRDFANAATAILDPGGVRVTGETPKPVMPSSPPPSTPPPSSPPPAAPPPRMPTPQLGAPYGAGYGHGGPPPQQRKSRRGLWLAVAGVVVLAGAGAGVAVALSGGKSDKKPSTAGSSAQYTALLARLPELAKQSCADTTAQLPAPEVGHVQTVASCTQTIGTAKLTMTYRTLLGSANDVTSFRQKVLGLGGDNHHGGDCLTLQPAAGQAVGNKGFAQDVTLSPTMVGRIWCSKDPADGTLWYLQAKPAVGALPIMTEVQTSQPGGAANARDRQQVLVELAPLS
jgi:serine/threonine protein kinase